MTGKQEKQGFFDRFLNGKRDTAPDETESQNKEGENANKTETAQAQDQTQQGETEPATKQDAPPAKDESDNLNSEAQDSNENNDKTESTENEGGTTKGMVQIEEQKPKTQAEEIDQETKKYMETSHEIMSDTPDAYGIGFQYGKELLLCGEVYWRLIEHATECGETVATAIKRLPHKLVGLKINADGSVMILNDFQPQNQELEKALFAECMKQFDSMDAKLKPLLDLLIKHCSENDECAAIARVLRDLNNLTPEQTDEVADGLRKLMGGIKGGDASTGYTSIPVSNGTGTNTGN